MSKVLMIRHLPAGLPFYDKEQLLKHFGAEQVWESRSKRHYIFASFGTVEKAKSSLSRLHQLEIAHRRLVVEFSFENEPTIEKKADKDEISCTTKLVKEFMKVINAWNPSIDFYQPPPPHLKYKYPDINPITAINIVCALFTHKPFYIQALHLMNKMSLDVPFKENMNTIAFFKETFKSFFLDVQTVPAEVEETESEISSEETESKQQTTTKLVKRKRKLPNPSRKLPGTVPTAPKTMKTVNQKEVFETVPQLGPCPKKISVLVTQDALQKPAQDPGVVGELGKFQKEEVPVIVENNVVEPEQPPITKSELLKNRISYKDMKILPVFKNYHSGQPSMRLYIKNLAKTVTEADVKRIYKRYIDHLGEEEQIGFDVRVMQEGRMKGQAFVTFPSVRFAETALNETNGYILKEKPMVVQFARVANKKTTE